MRHQRDNCVGKMLGACASLLLLASVGTADIRLPAIVGDNMVLQQGRKVPLWGWADPGETVSIKVSWKADEQRVTAGKDGKWKLAVQAPAVGGPYEITLTGKNTIALKDILCGEVWVCSGQSNMEWPVASAASGDQEVASAECPKIRLFTVQKKIAATPEADCVGQWVVCSPQTVGGFSAVGYFFGRHLLRELNVPIGLINTSWGGTVAEAWTSEKTLVKIPEFKAAVDRIAEARANPDAAMKKYEQELAEWQKKTQAAGVQGGEWARIDFDDSVWKQMNLPVLWEQTELGNFDGLVWFRKVIEVPNSWVGKELTLDLGPIDDMDTTWVNGVKVGAHMESGQWMSARQYKIGPNIIKPGPNVIAVQVVDTGGGGGMYGQPAQMRIKPTDAADDAAISLAGQWRYRVGMDLASMPKQPEPPAWSNNPNAPTVLYNGMIAPLIPFAIRGAIWYQGESNADRAYQYRRLFPDMIADWRRNWDIKGFPFLFVQLANFMAEKPEPADSAWAELREAQCMTLSRKNTGMATIIDIGDAADIHPKNKQDVGKRLALWALAKTYEKDVVYSGPLYRSMKARDGKIVLQFDCVGDGLVAKGGPLKGFAIAGTDRKFVWADAVIEGKTVVVSSDKVSKPVAVRYAWADNPACNLYNAADLPASPFRTDDWPGLTADKK
ncbi:MAG: sialate O-acetylesterase [Solirubrobacterales bacterium]